MIKPCVSIAIETSCRAGGVALGLDDRLVRSVGFDASARHATQLICRLDGLLVEASLRPSDLDHVYVSNGPGSFTGLRVGITVARTLAQGLDRLQCVAVPTPLVLADGACSLPWEHLGVIMDARKGLIYACLFVRKDRQIVAADEPAVLAPGEFLAKAPRPLTLIGEGLAYHDLRGDGVTIPDPNSPTLHLPTAEAVWRVGRRLAAAGRFTNRHQLLPVYPRRPDAVRPRRRQR